MRAASLITKSGLESFSEVAENNLFLILLQTNAENLNCFLLYLPVLFNVWPYGQKLTPPEVDLILHWLSVVIGVIMILV